MDLLSFDQDVFLNKARIVYIMIYNNLAPSYLHEMFQMEEIKLDSTMSNLKSFDGVVLKSARNLFPLT